MVLRNTYLMLAAIGTVTFTIDITSEVEVKLRLNIWR